MKSLMIFTASLFLTFLIDNAKAEMRIYEEHEGVVVIEAENTTSKLGEWQVGKSIRGFTGKGYLEFTGNNFLSGPPTSPLEYNFKINQGGLYYLHLLCARETKVIKGETRKDVANDCYVRVEGDYASGPNPGDKHGKDAPLELLKRDTKFYGGKHEEFVWVSGNHLDPGGHNNKRVAVYQFKAGETYKLVVSGRSKAYKLDRIVFRLKAVRKDSAQNRGAKETLQLKTSDEENASSVREIPEKFQLEKSSNLIKPPAGRLAIVADGNSPDPDDIGALAVTFGLLQASQLSDRLVHLSHSCDLQPVSRISKKDELRRQNILHQVCKEGVERFGPFRNLESYFNCRTHQKDAIADLSNAIESSSKSNPLWIVVAGEPDIIGYALSQEETTKHKYVHLISHHPANDNSGDFFRWQQLLNMGVTEHQIGDQNKLLQTPVQKWDWVNSHDNQNFSWMWNQLSYAERDGVVKFQSNKFDCSDAGMVYWWITGGNQGGDVAATPCKIRSMLQMHFSQKK